MSWYQKGWDGRHQERRDLERKYGAPRFRVPPSEKREIVFVDEQPFCIHEHDLWLDRRKVFVTCLRGITDEVPCCESNERSRSYVGYLTVVQCTEWRDKGNNVHQFEILLFPAKLGTMDRFDIKREERGGLAGHLYTARRYEKTDAVVGAEHEWAREADMAALFKVSRYKGKLLSDLYDKAESDDDAMKALRQVFDIRMDKNGKIVREVVPFNYPEVLAPRSVEDVQLLFARKANQDSALEAETDNVPF